MLTLSHCMASWASTSNLERGQNYGGCPIVSASEDFIAISFACPFHHHRTIGLQHMQKACPGTLDLRRNHPNSSIDLASTAARALKKGPKVVLASSSCFWCLLFFLAPTVSDTVVFCAEMGETRNLPTKVVLVPHFSCVEPILPTFFFPEQYQVQLVLVLVSRHHQWTA